MENASKALLIAGAVLIVILLIGVGMMIYRGATSNINSSVSQMNAQQIQMFNQQFEQYAGSKLSGTKVKSLISTVNATIATDENVQLTLSGNGVTGTTGAYDLAGKTTDRYTITVKDETPKDGLIDTITITKNT